MKRGKCNILHSRTIN